MEAVMGPQEWQGSSLSNQRGDVQSKVAILYLTLNVKIYRLVQVTAGKMKIHRLVQVTGNFHAA